MPAPPVPEDHVEMTFLLKNAEYAKKVGSPSPEANEVSAYKMIWNAMTFLTGKIVKMKLTTPPIARGVLSANATQIKPPIATMHENDMRTFDQKGRNGDKLLMISPGTTSARRIAPVERWLHGLVPKGIGVVVSDSS